MKRLSAAFLVALFVTMMIALVPNSAAANDGYIECMNNAITYKYALIDSGWSYSAAHAQYLQETTACYTRFYGYYY